MGAQRFLTSVIGLVGLGIAGCATVDSSPRTGQVEDFVRRRTVVVSAVNDIEKPMMGTTYAGIAQHLAESSGERIKAATGGNNDDMIRRGVRQFGHYQVEPNVPLEFDVELSEELVKEVGRGEVAKRLNLYYARELERQGWFISGWHVGGTSLSGVAWTAIWTDRERGIRTVGPDGSVSVSQSIREPYDTRRGYFSVLIAVRVDMDANRAHVAMNYWGTIGS